MIAAYVTVVAGALLIGALFAVAGQLLFAAVDDPLPWRTSANHVCWLAVAVLVAAKALQVAA